MEPRKLTARVAGYLDAIRAARERGITWAELAEVFSARSAPALRAAVRRARSAVDTGRIVPGEQMLLPEPPQQAVVVLTSRDQSTPAPQVTRPSQVAAPPTGQKYTNFKRLNID